MSTVDANVDAIFGKLEDISNEQLRLSIVYRVRCTIPSRVCSLPFSSFHLHVISFQIIILEPANMRTDAVLAYSSPFNEQVDISLFVPDI